MRLGRNYSLEKVSDLPDSIRTAADFAVLRRLHAAQAEILATKPFRHPVLDTDMFLLDDQELRDAYGSTVGKVAHSHHWNVDRLPHELRDQIGAPPGFPGNWTVNAIKVAAILRCADAAHIDSDRAPTMLFALSRPQGASFQHWSFQNKVLQSTTREDRLLFSSREPFGLQEARSWWLGYDVITMIDRELSLVSDLLERLDLPRFEVSGVIGAESPRLLAKHIETEGWIPVNARIQVSDPTHLARTLGGRNLYGDRTLAPIRELLTNAVDSVRARRTAESRDIHWGTVRITICRTNNAENSCWIHVDDTGLGMSEPVLTSALLDFGTSFWSSSAFQEEYPGLISRGFKPSGKFGIGFFSSFMLGENVKVITRPYRDGEIDAKVLEFSSLEEQPILRSATSDEYPKDFVTRVSVRVSLSDEEEYDADFVLAGDSFLHGQKHDVSVIGPYVRSLVATLDVTVEFRDEVHNCAFNHQPNWHEQSIGTILSDLEPDYSSEFDSTVEDLFQFVEQDGIIVGVAALPVAGRLVNVNSYVSVDGFTYKSAERVRRRRRGVSGGRYVGIVAGDTDDLTRQTARPSVSGQALEHWAGSQARRIAKLNFAPIDGMTAAREVLSVGGDSGELPFSYHQGEFLNYADTRALIKDLSKIIMPMQVGYGCQLTSVSELQAAYFTNPLARNVLVVATDNLSLLFIDERVSEELRETEGQYVLNPDDVDDVLKDPSLVAFGGLLEESWAVKPSAVVQIDRVFEETTLSARGPVWVLSLSRNPT
jgi:hypothetical protein